MRIDHETSAVSEAFTARIPQAVAVGEGAVWVASSRDFTIIRYDLASADLLTINVGGTPSDIAAGGGAAWVSVQV
jgi:hypothetical protein